MSSKSLYSEDRARDTRISIIDQLCAELSGISSDNKSLALCETAILYRWLQDSERSMDAVSARITAMEKRVEAATLEVSMIKARLPILEKRLAELEP